MACPLSQLYDDLRIHVLTAVVSDEAIAALSPGEAAAVRGAAHRRRREYATARALAREGLARHFGIHDFELINAEDRSPIWPPGITGSVSHTTTRAWVALADATLGTIGIDGECRTGLERRLWHLTLREEEIASLDAFEPRARERYALAMFCAKEALYKAQYPRTRCMLGFMSVRVQLHAQGTFDCVFQRDVGPFPIGCTLSGRWRDQREILAGIRISRSVSGSSPRPCASRS